MYEPYPTGGQVPPKPSRPELPRQVRNAAWLMYTGAGLSAVSLIIGLLNFHAIERAIARASKTTLTASQLHSITVAAVAVIAVESLIAIGLWLLMAWANRAGKTWGRIVASVLFGVNTILLLLGLIRPGASLSEAFSVLVWLIGLTAIVLLWTRASSEYFTAMNPPH